MALALALLVSVGSSQATAAPRTPEETRRCVDAADRGQEALTAKRLVEARGHLEACANVTCPEVVQRDCASWLQHLAAATPSVSFRVVDAAGNDVPEAIVSEAGQRPIALGVAVELDPGAHAIEASSAQGKTVMHIVVAEGERGRVVVLRLPRAAPPANVASPPRDRRAPARWVWPWVAAGVSVAGYATFGILQATAAARYDKLDDTCGRTAAGCTESQIAGFTRQVQFSAVGLGVGIAGTAAALVLWAVAPKAPLQATADGVAYTF